MGWELRSFYPVSLPDKDRPILLRDVLERAVRVLNVAGLPSEGRTDIYIRVPPGPSDGTHAHHTTGVKLRNKKRFELKFQTDSDDRTGAKQYWKVGVNCPADLKDAVVAYKQHKKQKKRKKQVSTSTNAIPVFTTTTPNNSNTFKCGFRTSVACFTRFHLIALFCEAPSLPSCPPPCDETAFQTFSPQRDVFRVKKRRVSYSIEGVAVEVAAVRASTFAMNHGVYLSISCEGGSDSRRLPLVMERIESLLFRNGETGLVNRKARMVDGYPGWIGRL
eukprot:TRINITY_DN9399_c0_g1_i1.p1 TRINITY_DN9399_c0_g1~~TRINITY_DN9399_c0_g1_i1.p1  ORF type:complete len:276 (-),score=38.08 TRINITY_DN9399_c0_g1_i1:356-1183(-)